MYVYRNTNTGDEVTRDERSVRLDHLPNWSLVSEPDPVEEKTGDGPPARNASTDVWRAYAVAQGMPADEAAGHSRDELAALYTGQE